MDDKQQLNRASPTYVHKIEYKWGLILLAGMGALYFLCLPILVFSTDSPPMAGVIGITLAAVWVIWISLFTILSKLDLRVNSDGLARLVFGLPVRRIKWQDVKKVTARIAHGRSYSGFLIELKRTGLGNIAEVKHQRRLPLVITLNAYLSNHGIPVREVGYFGVSDHMEATYLKLLTRMMTSGGVIAEAGDH